MALLPEEQARRRKAMQDALTNARLEGLEPDPVYFEYMERYIRGEVSLTELLADFSARLAARAEAR